MSEADDQSQTLPNLQAQPLPGEGDSLPPRLLGGRYRLAGRIASGGMASVWQAHDEILARTVAVKLLHDHLAADQAFRERFRREAVAAAKLTHPNIVGLYDTGTDARHVYLVMEFVDGPTLRDVLNDRGRLEPPKAAAIGEQVARALDYAHDRGLVHRDVKPANILLGSDGAVKVADFGIAKAEEADDLTRTGVVLGTAAYVAPEQILAETLDGKADQFSLGVVLYEALTGRQPFKGDSPMATAAMRLEEDPAPPRSIQREIPQALEQVTLRALARRREDRFPDTARFADALARFAQPDHESTATLAATVTPAPATVELPRERESSRDGAARAPRGGTTGELPAIEQPRKRPRGRVLRPLALMLLVGAVVLSGVTLLPRLVAQSSALFDRIGDAVTESEVVSEVPRALSVVALQDFDPPPGDGEENGADLDTLIDQQPDTTWRTELYRTSDFGGLKEGVGYWLDLGGTQRIDEVVLETPAPGFDVELRVADTAGATLDQWRPVTAVDGLDGRERLVPAEQTSARFLLVWVTGDLQAQGGQFAAEFSSLSVLGASAEPAQA